MATTPQPVSYDFDDQVQALTNFLKTTDEFKDYNYDGAAIKELVRLLSYNAQMSAYRANFMFNEMDLRTADLRENVASIASIYGYTTASKTAATMLLDIIVIPDNPLTAKTSITLSTDNGFVANKDGTLYTFYPTADIIANYDATNNYYLFTSVPVRQGKWQYNSFVIQSKNGVESFEIPNANIDTSTLTVSLYQNPSSTSFQVWDRVTSGYDLGSTSQNYFLKENRLGKYEVEFGDGVLLAKPDFGAVVVCKYLITDGPDANDISSAAPAGPIDGYFNVNVVTSDGGTSYGGADVEDIESIRQAAPLVYQSLGNAVTDIDYQALVKKLYSNAGDVIAYGGELAEPPKYGYTYVAVKPVTGTTLTDAQKTELYNILKKVNVGSITPIIIDPDYIYINVSLAYSFNKKKTILTQQAINAKFFNALTSYSSDKLEKFKRNFSYSDLVAFVRSIDSSIIDFNINTKYEKQFVPILNTNGIYQFNFYHEIIPGSVVVSNFRVADTDYVGYTYTLVDDANGNINLQKVGTNGTVLIAKNIGVVDYTKGVVNLSNFNPNSVIDGYVSVTVSPAQTNQSLSGIRDNILAFGRIDVSSEVVNV